MIKDRAVIRYYYFIYPVYETLDLQKRAVFEQLQGAYAQHLAEVGKTSAMIELDDFLSSQRNASIDAMERIALPVLTCQYGNVAVTFDAFSVYEGAYLSVKWQVVGGEMILPELYAVLAKGSPQDTSGWRTRPASKNDGTVNYLGTAWVYYGEDAGLMPVTLADEWRKYFPEPGGQGIVAPVAVGDGGNLALWKNGQSLDLMFAQNPSTVSSPVNQFFWDGCLPGLLLARLKSDFFFLCIKDALQSLSAASADMERFAREVRPPEGPTLPRGLDVLRLHDERLTNGSALIQRKLQQVEADVANLRAQSANVGEFVRLLGLPDDSGRLLKDLFTGRYLARLKLHRALIAHAKGYLAWIANELASIRSSVDHIDKSWNLIFARTIYLLATIQAISSFVAVVIPLYFSTTAGGYEKAATVVASILIASIAVICWWMIEKKIASGSGVESSGATKPG